jgi:hypothetical protein
MTDIIERAEKALEDYEKNKKEWRHGFAKELFATPALTLLPEAIEEIKRLRNLVEEAIEIMEAGPFFPEQEAQVLREKLKGDTR